MFNIAEEKGIELTLTQKLAILFHDIEYIPGFIDNEIESVSTMLKYFDNYWPYFMPSWPCLSKASSIILATANHAIDQDVDEETGIILDLDIADIGTYIFWENDINLEKENPVNYIESKIKFITKMLKRNKIYYSEFFIDQEDQARKNLKIALASCI